METDRLELCKEAELEEGCPIRIEIEGHPPLAVVRFEDSIYVVDDTCSHGEASLSEGTVEDGQIECPWHAGRFCLKTGAALAFPAVVPIRAYPVTVRDGTVYINPGPEHEQQSS